LKNYLKRKTNLKIRSIFNKENLGFCEGNNVGVRTSKGEYIIFLSDDTIVDKNWLKELIDPFSWDKNVGGAASKVIFYGKGAKILQYAGGKIAFYGKAISEGVSQIDQKNFNFPKQTLWGQGCSIAFKRKVLDELEEYFCPQFFIYFDDVDLCWRVRGIGYKMVYNPKSFLYHKGSVAVETNVSEGFVRESQLLRNIRNKYLTFWRNLKIYHLPLIMPFVFGYDIIKSFYFIGRGGNVFYGNRFNHLKCAVRAFFGFLYMMFKVKRPRKAKLSDLTFSFR
jgi:hypothetical protein